MIITNWYPDPDLNTRDFSLENAKTAFWPEPEHMVNITPVTVGKQAVATITVTGLPAGALFTCRTTIDVNKGTNHVPLAITDNGWALIKNGEKDAGGNLWHAEFTVPTDGTVRVRFFAPSVDGGSIALHGNNHLFLGLNSDYAALQKLGLRGFSGNTMPLS